MYAQECSCSLHLTIMFDTPQAFHGCNAKSLYNDTVQMYM